jgi:4'-phosphopantetheinyl transferase
VSVDEFDSRGNCARAGAGRAGELFPLPPVEPGVSLWWSDLAHDAGEIARVAAWLSPAEHARAARFGTEALRRKYIAGRASLRLVLGRTLGLEPAAVPLRRGVRGRPELAAATPHPVPDFNLSHTRGGAVIGIADGLPAGTRIGVDVEREDRTLAADRLARKFLSPPEQAALAGLDADRRRREFLRWWTCKEAMSKATGDGLVAPFARLTVEIGGRLALVAGPPPYVPEAWRLHAIAAPAGFLATVALWRGDPDSTPRPRQ